MANAVLSNRERKDLRKQIPKAARVARGEPIVRVAVDNGAPPEPADRDGLVWLHQKRRLTPDQLREAFAYRAVYRDAGEVSLKSALECEGGGGGYSSGAPSPIETQTGARRALMVVRFQVLRGQVDMLTVMDGVCGCGHTPRALAGGHQQRARDLETLLKAALDLIVAYRKEPGTGA